MKKEKNYFKTALIIVSVIAVILAIVLVIKIKELSNVNQRNKELSNELQQLKDGVISMNNNSDENKKQEYDGFDGRADYDPETDELSQEYWLDTYEYLIGKFLSTYGLTDDGSSIIFTRTEEYIPISLELYKDENEKNAKYAKSNETVTINGNNYTLYKTGIDFEKYKEDLMEMMSEEVFEKYFTTYAKNINGELYIVNDSLDNANEEFIIDSFEIINDDTYKVTFTHIDGTEEQKKEVTAKFSLNEDGSVIVEEINL